MQVLLTGATGFIGLNIAEALLDEGTDVVMYASSPLLPEAEVHLKGKKANFYYYCGNILDKSSLDAVFSKFNIDAVIHAAAITPNEEREVKEGKQVIEVNCIGTLQVMEASRRNFIDKVIYISSIASYGSSTLTHKILKEEETPEKPVNMYEITKFTAEKIVLRYGALTGLNVISAKLGDIYGPWEYKTDVRDNMSAPFQTTRLAMLGEKAILPRRGYKPWVYSKDVAGAIVALLKTQKLNFKVYNISSPYSWSVENWCALLQRLYPDFRYEIKSSNEQSNVFMFADNAPMDINRLIEDTGYQPQYNLNKSFNDYIEWIHKSGSNLLME